MVGQYLSALLQLDYCQWLTYSWTDANGNPVAWSDSMKGQGWCGGNAKPNGYMIYMSTDELYNQGYSLLYGQ